MNTVILSEVEEPRCENEKLTSRGLSISLGMTGGRSSRDAGLAGARPSNRGSN
jgi:hypothetical protein